MRQSSPFCYFICSLLQAAIYFPFALVRAQDNVFLRGDRSGTSGTDHEAFSQGHSTCPGVRTIRDFPSITGGTTSIIGRSPQSALDSVFSGVNSQELLEKCSDDSGVLEAPGVWYRFIGPNAFVHATLLFENQSDQRMAVFEGDGCQPSKCLLVSDPLRRQMDWFAERDSAYFIKVFGTSLQQAGAFVIHMEEFFFPRPHNDRCRTAEKLSIGTITRDASFVAWPHGIGNRLCDLDIHSRGLFYEVEGTGGFITITLQPDVSHGKLGFAVLRGNRCGICMGHSAYISAMDSKQIIRLQTQKDEKYRILVSGEGINDVGIFKLTIAQ